MPTDLHNTPAVLEAVGVSKHFAGVHALREVNFSLRAGQVHALVGENGAGKSTLIKVLTGVYRPDSGDVRFLGGSVSFSRPAEAQTAGISTVYQEVNLIPSLSVAHNLFLGHEPRTRWGTVDFRRMRTESVTLLADLGIPVDPRRELSSLGLGVQQMVAIARAVHAEARVVIMDEPTSSLEPREVDTLFSVIRKLHSRNVAVVYVSHRMEELYTICDSVTVLRDGQTVHSGAMADISRLELVATMLGRNTAEIRSEGTTAFSERHDTTSETEVPVLQATDLRKRTTLTGVNLTVRPGEVVGLGGLLGSGRTETVTALAGILPLDAGNIRVAGKQIRRGSAVASIRAGMVLVPEDRKAEGIIPHLSVRENIVLAALPRLSRFGVISRAKQNRVVDIFMKRLRIKAASPEQKVSELSGGNQQKVMLARWLAMEPKVLLLDEPTRGIDVGAKAEVQALIEELAEQGLGIVMVSSELDELVAGADRVVVLREGGSVAELHGAEVSVDGVLNALAQASDEAATAEESA